MLFLFFAIRVIAAYFMGEGEIPLDDSKDYNRYALAVLTDSGWLRSPDFFGSAREPGYPLFLASAYLLFGKGNYFAVHVLQALIGALTAFIIYKLSLGMFGKTAGFIAFIWSGFYSFYIWHAIRIGRETLVCFLMALFFYLFFMHLADPADRKVKIFTPSLAFFMLIHTDSRYLYLLPCILLLFVIYQRPRRAIKDFFIFAIMALMLSLPWAARNYLAYNEFVLINTQHVYPGWNIIKGFKYRNERGWHIIDTRTLNVTHNPDYPTEEERRSIKSGLNPNNRSKEEIVAIRKDIYPSSAYWGRRWFCIKEIWRPFMLHGIYSPFPSCLFLRWSFRHNFASLVSYMPLLPFALIAIAVLAIRKNKNMWFFILPASFHTFAHVFTWGDCRYRYPIDFFLIILAGYGLSYLIDHGRQG